MGDWCTIESDPGVFTELIAKFGVENVQVTEIWDVDDLKQHSPYGLIFLFKYVQEEDPRPVLTDPPGVFFAKQIVTNACATQAILAILLNRPELKLGPVLENFQSFASVLPPEMRGMAIGNIPELRNVHNSFSRPEPFAMESRVATKDDDVYHFVAYVPVAGMLYELDGLKDGPIALGACGENWTDVAAPAIRARMERYAKSETGFNLMALIENKKVVLERKLEEAKAAVAQADGDTSALDLTVQTLQEGLAAEEKLQAKWTAENIRRRHNYIPFIFQLCSALARKGELEKLAEEGRKATQARAEANAKSKTSN
jgi:ubiquitin carboxyl-terminal hydrolase L5